MIAPLSNERFADARGVSLVELLIVVAMVSVLVGFALMQVSEARQDLATT